MDKSWQTRKSKAVTSGAAPSRGRLLQRKCACGGQAGSGGECEECNKKKVQRKGVNAAGPSVAPPIVHEVLSSPGQPLDAATRGTLEPRFGHDFGQVAVHAGQAGGAGAGLAVAPPDGSLEQHADRMANQAVGSGGAGRHSSSSSSVAPGAHHDFGSVRVHADARAAESAEAVNALAYTVGHHIVFGAHQYQPGTAEGQRLLAHELTHVAQQADGTGPGAGSGLMQRKVAVDPAKFTGPKAAKDKADFEQMLVDELKTVSGMNLAFSSDVLTSTGAKPAGGSATAAMVVDMALRAPETIFLDPRAELGGEETPRGIQLSTTRVPVELKAMRTGIVIIHELGHRFGNVLKPADYDKKMKDIQDKVKKGGAGAVTPEEAEAWMNYNPNKNDENIAVGVANKVQAELGLMKRIHYGFPMEYPPKPGATGMDKVTTYAIFQTADQPPLFIYLDVKTYDVYSSKIDYFAEALKTQKAPAPTPQDFTKIVKGTPAYKAIEKHIL